MIKFDISPVQYDFNGFKPFRKVCFKYTPELAQDVSSHMVMDTIGIAKEEFGQLLEELNKNHTGGFSWDGKVLKYAIMTEQRTDFPTGEEILEKTLEQRRINFNQTLEEIETKINDASNRGDFHITMESYRIPSEVEVFLTKKGFSIKDGFGLSSIISWNPENK